MNFLRIIMSIPIEEQICQRHCYYDHSMCIILDRKFLDLPQCAFYLYNYSMCCLTYKTVNNINLHTYNIQSIQMSQKGGYEKYLQSMLKQQHSMTHTLVLQLQQEKSKNNKLLNQLASVRKKQNDYKIRIKDMQQRIKQLQMIIQAKRNPAKKPAVQKVNMLRKNKEFGSIQQLPLDRKAIFKQFISDNYPKYKDVVKKALSFILHIERHASKSPKQRIDTYYQIWGQWLRKFLSFFISSKQKDQKYRSIAETMVQKWKGDENKMKQLMIERNKYKNNQDQYLDKIQKLQGSQAKLLANKKAFQSKIFAYQTSLQLKGAQFAVHLKKMLLAPDEIQQNDKLRLQKILQTMTQLSQRKIYKNENNNKTQNLKRIEEKFDQKNTISQIKSPQNDMKQTRGNSSIKLRKNAPVLKKNIFGYYQNPQLNNNQPNLILTRHPILDKCVQTVPQDLSIVSIRPVILMTIVDGMIKSQRNRHCLNFYVRVNYNQENNLYFNSKLSLNSLQPIWNDSFLLYGYNFPFFTLDVMTQSKGVKDYSIANGRLQVSRTQIPKYLNVKNNGQYQGRIRFSITYPKGRIYQFVINSVKLVYPQSYPMGKDTLTIQMIMNPSMQYVFQIGEKIKYFDDNYKKNNKFIILDGFEGEIKTSFQKIAKKGSISFPQISKKLGQKQIQIFLQRQWSVVLSGVLLLIVSQQDEPEIIQQQNEPIIHKYFSMLAQKPIVKVQYNSMILPSHIKLPLVFRFEQARNYLTVYKKIQKLKNTQQQKKTKRQNKKKQNLDEQSQQIQESEISPIVLPNTNVICEGHRQVSTNKRILRAPKVVYEMKIKMIEGNLPVELTTQQYFFEKILAEVQLKCGQRFFSVPAKDLIQNHYISVGRTLKDIGYIKFKIGFLVHQNLLQDKFKQPQQNIQIIKDKQLDVLDNSLYYLKSELTTLSATQYSSTADYKVVFQFGNSNETSKKTGSIINYNQLFIFPFNQPLNIKIIQYTVIGNKCIYEGPIKFDQKDLKLKCKFIHFGPRKQSFVYFGLINCVSDLYSLKIQKISGEFAQDTDWIGKMDPYIRFEALNKIIYTTEKIQGAGTKTIWNNDQFVALTTDDQIKLSVFDDDLIGKDDYLGQCIVKIPEKPTRQLEGVLRKLNQGQKQQGKIILNGLFNKMADIAQYKINYSTLNWPKNIYKITIYKLEINDKQIGDSDTGYISYKVGGFEIKSQNFDRVSKSRIDTNGQKDGAIYLDYSIWIKAIEQNKQDILLEITKVSKTFFSKKQQVIAQVRIKANEIEQAKLVSLKQEQIKLKNSKSFIGNIYYIVQPVQSTRIIHIQAKAINLSEEKVYLVSDSQDCVVIKNQQDGNSQAILAYDENWYVLSEQEYNIYINIDKHQDYTQSIKYTSQTKYRNNWMQNLGYDNNHILKIDLRNQKHRNSVFQTPNMVFLAHCMQFVRKSHPVLNTGQLQKTAYKNQLLKKGIYKLNHLKLKNVSTNKNIIGSDKHTQLFLIIRWPTYQIRVPINCQDNMNLPQKILRNYVGQPFELLFVEKKKEKQGKNYEKVNIIFREEFVCQKKVIYGLKQGQSNQNQQKNYKIVYVNTCVKYKNSKIILSCQFQKQEQSNQINKQQCILQIPWMFLQYPFVNMNSSSHFKNGDKYEWFHQLLISFCFSEEKDQKKRLQSQVVIFIKSQDIPIEGRSIYIRQIFWPLLFNSKALLILQENMPVDSSQANKDYISDIYFSFEAGRKQIKSKQQYNMNYTVSQQDVAYVGISSLGRMGFKSNDRSIEQPYSEYIFTNKYNNGNMITTYSQIHLYQFRNLKESRPGVVGFLSNKVLIFIQQLIVDINDNIDTFDIDKCQLYLILTNPKTQSSRIIQLSLMDRSKKKYKIEQRSIYNRGIVIESPDSTSYCIKICALSQKGVMNKIFNKSNKNVIGQALCLFDKWEAMGKQTVMLQLKEEQPEKSKDQPMNVVGLDGKVVGFVKIKYNCQQISNQNAGTQILYKQLDIDRVVLQLTNLQVNTVQKIRFQCNVLNKYRQQVQQYQQLPYAIFYAQLVCKKSKNQYNQIFDYRFSQKILVFAPLKDQQRIIMNQNNIKWPDCYDISIYDDKYNTLLGAFNSQQLLIVDNQELQLHKGYKRWSKLIRMSNLPSAIIVGSFVNVQLLNSKLKKRYVQNKQQQKKQTKVEKQNLKPSPLMICDKIGQTIVQFTLSKFFGMIEPRQGQFIHLTLQTSQRIIRNRPIKYYKQKNEQTGQKQFVYTVYMQQKQLFNTNIKVSICNKKSQPMYTAQLISEKVSEIGCLIFYNPHQKQQIKQHSSRRMPCGTCIYSVCLPFSTQIRQTKDLQVFLQISNIQVQSYLDTQIFGKMTPYLIINQCYISTVGVGKDDLFWKLGTILPLSQNKEGEVKINQLQICVNDKDLFFDDRIGSAVVEIPSFDIKTQLLSDINEKLSSKQHSVLRLQELTHQWVNIQEKGKLTGRLKIQYRYLSTLPVVLLYSSQDETLSINIENHLEQILQRLTQNRFKQRLNFFNTGQEIVQIKLNQSNMEQFLKFNRQLVLKKIDDKNNIKLEKKQVQFVYINGAKLSKIDKGLLDLLGVTRGKQILMYMKMNYKSLKQKKNLEETQILWRLVDSSAKDHRYSPINSNKNGQLNQIFNLPLSRLLNYQQKPPKSIKYLQKFSIFVQKSQINTIEYLQIYVLTQYTAIMLCNNLNANFIMHGQNTYSQVIDVQPKGLIIPISDQSTDQQIGEIKIILYDRQTGFSCSTHIQSERKRKKKGKSHKSLQKQRSQVIYPNMYNKYYESADYIIEKINNQKIIPPENRLKSHSGKYLVINKMFSTNKHQIKQQFKQQVGIIYLSINQIGGVNPAQSQQRNSDQDKIKGLIDKLERNIPIKYEQLTGKLLNTIKNANSMLKVRICKAIMLKDIQIFSKMDPYCEVYLRNTRDKRNTSNLIYKTKVANDKGKVPIWEQQFYIKIPFQSLQNTNIYFILQFVLKDQEITIDRQIGYAQFNISNYVSQQTQIVNLDNGKSNKQIIITLSESEDNKNKSGDLFILLSTPILRFIMFTHITIHNHFKENDQIVIYYEPSKFDNNIDQQTQMKANQIVQSQMMAIQPSVLYPLSSEIRSIKIAAYYKSINKVYVKILSLEQLYVNLYKVDAKIMMIDPCLQIGYLLCQSQQFSQHENKRKNWNHSFMYSMPSIERPKKKEQSDNEAIFILQDKQQKILKQIKQEQGSMFVLDEAADNQKQIQADEVVFILGEQKNRKQIKQALQLGKNTINNPKQQINKKLQKQKQPKNTKAQDKFQPKTLQKKQDGKMKEQKGMFILDQIQEQPVQKNEFIFKNQKQIIKTQEIMKETFLLDSSKKQERNQQNKNLYKKSSQQVNEKILHQPLKNFKFNRKK